MNDRLELIAQNTIRIETALSRFPVHKLARQRGNIIIDIKKATSAGEIKTKWEVTHNSKYGQPGPLAYKIDTLIINRRIDDERPAIPKVLKLGSLGEICREIGMPASGRNTNHVKKALRQNAFAGITAKITYKATDGAERSIEADFTRYSVIFTGERFPDGRRANAVYLILNDIYMKVLNEAQTRPLDYDYLRDLPPASQRFYELIGFQIYAVLKHERPRARMLYSELCTRTPQTRYYDWEHVRKQMYKVHAPHLKSGYIAKVEFQEQRHEGNELDWIMFYTPGGKAKVEFTEATKKPRKTSRPTQTLLPLTGATIKPELSPSTAIYEVTSDDDPLLTKLTNFKIAEATARELTRHYRKSVELQLRALPHRNLNKIHDLASWLVVAIKENHALPETTTEALANEEEAKRAIAKKEATIARQRDEEARRAAYFDFLRGRAGKIEKTQPEAYRAFLNDSAAKRAELERDPVHKGQGKKILLRVFDDDESHLERFRDYFNELGFEDWLQTTQSES